MVSQTQKIEVSSRVAVPGRAGDTRGFGYTSQVLVDLVGDPGAEIPLTTRATRHRNMHWQHSFSRLFDLLPPQNSPKTPTVILDHGNRQHLLRLVYSKSM